MISRELRGKITSLMRASFNALRLLSNQWAADFGIDFVPSRV
jgi:hypothetical protein